MKRKINVITLGCSKNLVDSEHLMAQLQRNGFEIVHDSNETDARIVVINTCGFIGDAKEESVNTILAFADAKTKGCIDHLFVMGCLAERYREELREEIPEVDEYFGVNDLRDIVKTVGGRYRDELTGERHLTTPGHYAYLKISEGCNWGCGYCAIPLIRGGRVSTPMETLLAEAEQLAKSGVTELTVIAQDTSAYGIDLYGKPMLRELLEKLTEIEGLHWVRVLYAYPNTVTEELVDAMYRNPKICNYIDIPIQHISAHMLRDMNRHGSAEHIREITDYSRRSAPGFILRTTVMLGFPGETEADFDELMHFMAEHPFDRVGAFTYSAEDGTPAASMPNAVDAETAEQRLDRLMRQQMKISLELNRARIGTVVEALVDGADEEFLFCRSYAEAADVDGIIKVPHCGNPVPAGSYVSIKITGADYYDLCGELVPPPKTVMR